MPNVEADLELNVQPALDDLAEVDAVFDAIIGDFRDGLDGIITDALTPQVDDIRDQISSLGEDLINAFAVDLPNIDLGDIGGDGIDIPINIDTDSIASQVEDAISGIQPEDIQLGVDLGDSADQVDDFSTELTDLQTKGQGASDTLTRLDIGATGLSAATSAATGNTKGLLATVAPGVGIFFGLAAGIGAAAETAARAQSAQERLERVFGSSSRIITEMPVKGLNQDLSTLAVNSGASGSKLKLAAAQLGQLALQAGIARPQAAGMGRDLIAISTYLSVTNPSLGAASDIVDRLSLTLGRGGRALARYGLDISTAEITARALNDTHKQSARQLTDVEKRAAGLAIAMEKLGPDMAEGIQKGQKNAEVSFRSLSQTIKNTIVEIGAPLIQPILTALKALTPVAVQVMEIFGQMFAAIAPAFSDIAQTLAPPLVAILGVLADILNEIPAPVITAVTAFLLLKKAFGALSDDLKIMTNLMGLNPYITIAMGILSVVSAIGLFGSGTDELTPKVDKLSQALYGNNASWDENVSKIFAARSELVKYLENDSRFKENNQGDDIQRLGLNWKSLADEIRNGSDGLNQFVRQAIEAGEIKPIKLYEQNLSVTQLKRDFESFGLTLKMTKNGMVDNEAAAAALTRAFNNGKVGSDEYERTLNKLYEGNTDLIASFTLEQQVLQATNEKKLRSLQLNDQISSGIYKEAIAHNTNKNGVVDYTAALDEAVQKQVLSTSATDAQATSALNAKVGWDILSAALDQAASKMPSVADATKSALDAVKQQSDQARDAVKNLFGVDPGETFDTATFTKSLNDRAQAIRSFYDNVTKIAQDGNPRLAAQILQLGPTAGAAAAQAFATAAPDVQRAAESAYVGLDAAGAYGQQKVQEMVQRSAVISELNTKPFKELGKALAAALGGDMNFGGIGLEQLEEMKRQVEAGIDPVKAVTNVLGAQAGQAAADGFKMAGPAVNAAATDVGTQGGWSWSSATTAKIDADKPAIHSKFAEAFTAGLPSTVLAAQGTGQAGGTGIGTGIAQTAPNSIASAIAIANSTFDYNMRIIFNGTAFNAGYGAGTLLASGLAQGINQHTDWITEAAKNAIIAAKGAAETQAKINSPSLVFAEIGDQLTEGLAHGMTRSIPMAESASRDIVQASATEARGTVVTDQTAAVQAATVHEGDTYITVEGVTDPYVAAGLVGREYAFQRRFS